MMIGFVGDSLTKGVPGCSYCAVLRDKLPGHTLINLGEGNDTSVSLYRRLAKMQWGEVLDLAFLWVGVNDVIAESAWSLRAVSTLMRKPRSTDVSEFRAYYRATLDLLCDHAHRVITVSPLLKGEDIGQPWNRDLDSLGQVIKELTAHYGQAEYLDLRSVFVQRLKRRPTSRYLPKSVMRVALDALTLRNRVQIDRKAAERGLYYTLDGIHLNSAGAEIVAETFAELIAG